MYARKETCRSWGALTRLSGLKVGGDDSAISKQEKSCPPPLPPLPPPPGAETFSPSSGPKVSFWLVSVCLAMAMGINQFPFGWQNFIVHWTWLEESGRLVVQKLPAQFGKHLKHCDLKICAQKCRLTESMFMLHVGIETFRLIKCTHHTHAESYEYVYPGYDP